MSTPTRTLTLLELCTRAATTGVAPTDQELEAVLDKLPAAGQGSNGPVSGQLVAQRKRLAIALAKLAERAGRQAALDDAEALAEEYSAFSSRPGLDQAQDPASLAAGVDRHPGGPANSNRAQQRQALAVVQPLRDLLEAATQNGPPSDRALDRLTTSLEGSELEQWRQRVKDACTDIRATFASGAQGEARQKAADYLEELGDALAEEEPEEDDEEDPRVLADRVTRTGGRTPVTPPRSTPRRSA